MATTTITDLPAASALSGTEPIPVDQAGATKKTTPAAIATYIGTLGGVQSATVTLTAADLAVLDSVPFELVPAPGAGKILVGSIASSYNKLNGGIVVGGTNVPSITFSGDVGQSIQLACQNWHWDELYNILTADSNYAHTNVAENQALVLQSADGTLDVPGAISTSAINAGGSGWAVNDTFTVDGSLGTSAEGVVDTVDGGGAILTYHLTNNVNGYLIATGVALTATSGVGIDATIDITALDCSVNPMTLTVTTLYSVMDV